MLLALICFIMKHSFNENITTLPRFLHSALMGMLSENRKVFENADNFFQGV